MADGDCEETLRELYVFLDGELDTTHRAHIKAHLDDCSDCLEAFDFEAELRMVIRSRCVEQVPDALLRRIADAIGATPPPLPGQE
jgi:mycothiol system anti-sigma-R factor